MDRVLKLEGSEQGVLILPSVPLTPYPVACERLVCVWGGALWGEPRSRARGSGRARAPSALPTTPPFQPFSSSGRSLMSFLVRVCPLCRSDNFGNSGLLWEPGNSFQAPVRPLPLERAVSIGKPAGFQQLLLCRHPDRALRVCLQEGVQGRKTAHGKTWAQQCSGHFGAYLLE